MEIFSGDNASEKVLKLINNKYKLFKVLLFNNIELNKQSQLFLEELQSMVKNLETINLPSNIQQGELATSLILPKITEDVGLIIVVGNVNLKNLVLSLKTKVKTLLVLTEPNLLLFDEKLTYVLADTNLINCSNKALASCLGTLCSNCFYILEEVFNKAVYLKEINSSKLLEIENCMQSLSMIPSSVLKSEVGKTILLNMCLKLYAVVNFEHFENCFVFKLANNIKSMSKYKNLLLGESLMISNVVAFKLLKSLIESKNINSLVGFSCFSRLKNYKKYCNNFSLSKVAESFFVDDNLQNHINNFFNVKASFSVVFYTYFDLTSKMLKEFKEIYFDKGICLNKYLDVNVLTNAVNIIPESCLENCFATFIRDVGLLNKF